MTDERGRKRDTPDGVFGPSGPPGKNAGHAPRGAGLSGNLPSGSRFGANDPKAPGSVPVQIQNQPRRTLHDPRAQDVSRGGAWNGDNAVGHTPPDRRRVPQEPPMAAPRSPAPPRPPPSSRVVDGFAQTRPAEVVSGRGPSQEPGARGVSRAPGASASPGSSRPNERGTGTAGAARALEGKPSLRLKLEGDTYYEANEGRVKVPKRRGPVFFGFLVVLTLLAVGAFLWIDAHGGIEKFVAALQNLGDPQDPAVQSSLKYDEKTLDHPAASGALVATPAPQPAAAVPPAAQQPSAAPEQPSEKPAQATPQPTGQVATGEVEAPDEQPASGAQPANDTGVKAEQQPVAAKPKPKPVAAKPKPKPVVRRDPVLKVQPLGDVLNAAPPDPGGGESLPPPDPPAPE